MFSDNLSARLERIKRFYKRNNTLFNSLGLIICGHIVWWEIQQNKAFIPKEQRIKHIGPITIPYIDELEYFKKDKPAKSE